MIKKYFFFFNKSNSNNYNKLLFFSIYILDLIFSYRGWRHLNLLPVRGQRTWTNSNSVFNSNKFLKNQKIFVIKNYLNINNINLVNSYITIEYINLLWKMQWTSEWLELKKKRLFFLKKKTKNLKLKIDDQSIFTELCSIRSKYLKKKSKVNSKNNYVALGFEPGFGSIFLK